MADTINVLSNAWELTDVYSRGYIGDLPSSTVHVDSRLASATTIQAAFLTGIDISGGANGTGAQDNGWPTYGGGLENYPRFHERWSGVLLTYRGSMVSLGAPRRSSGPWCGSESIDPSCNIYRPPSRDFSFDTDFTNAANLPPLTPRAVYLVQELFQRDFDRASSPSTGNFASALAPNLFGILSPSLSLNSLFQF